MWDVNHSTKLEARQLLRTSGLLHLDEVLAVKAVHRQLLKDFTARTVRPGSRGRRRLFQTDPAAQAEHHRLR